MTTVQGPAVRPCTSCPYRLDAPSGLWDAQEYAKLPAYDGDITSQALAGAGSVFMCHTRPQRLCAGWVGCHDMEENLGLRLASAHGMVAPDVLIAVMAYTSPVPLFASGREAADHGARDIDRPSPLARKHAMTVLAAQARREARRAAGQDTPEKSST